jgi:hypothetical protein
MQMKVYGGTRIQEDENLCESCRYSHIIRGRQHDPAGRARRTARSGRDDADAETGGGPSTHAEIMSDSGLGTRGSGLASTRCEAWTTGTSSLKSSNAKSSRQNSATAIRP